MSQNRRRGEVQGRPFWRRDRNSVGSSDAAVSHSKKGTLTRAASGTGGLNLATQPPTERLAEAEFGAPVAMAPLQPMHSARSSEPEQKDDRPRGDNRDKSDQNRTLVAIVDGKCAGQIVVYLDARHHGLSCMASGA